MIAKPVTVARASRVLVAQCLFRRTGHALFLRHSDLNTRWKMISLYKLLCLSALLLVLSGCSSTLKVLDGADYVCITGNLDGYFTDSGAEGRGIKVPEGETLTPELVAALCD